MRAASGFDPSVIINMHGCVHVTGLLNVPSVEEVTSRSQRPSSDDFIAFDSAGNPVGLLLLDRVHSWLCELSRILVVREREGIGSFIMGWTLRYAFDEHRVHRIFLEVHERNVRARRLYEHFGFTQEGMYRDGFRNPENGTFENLCPYGFLEDDYRAPLSISKR
jgi:RimJ/RimL family protein N-acetyltransferase